MLPEDFVEYSKRFKVGFLASLHDGKPHLDIVDFEVSRDSILVRGEDMKDSFVCLAFANEHYVWRSENASIWGSLKRRGDAYELKPDKMVWTLAFSIGEKPGRILRRWQAR